eukprot:scaffold50391_cov37-Cyclotella_meneghiniana.AAC.2
MANTLQTIEIVGFTASNNERTCANHDCCGESLVIDAANNGVGMMLRLRLTTKNELAAYTILADDSDGCRVGFTFRSFADIHGAAYDGCVVELVEVYTSQNEDRAERRKFHTCKGYSLARVVKSNIGGDK